MRGEFSTFQNPDFLFKNPDFPFKNPDFLLKHVELIMKTQAGSHSTQEVGRIPEALPPAGVLPGP